MSEENGKNRKEWIADDLDHLFQQLQDVISAIIRRLDVESPRDLHPFVYGLQIKIDSEGSPHIQEFGDLLPSLDRMITGKREPLTDICESGDEISITLEIPGVEQEQIETTAEGDKLIVSVDSGEIDYYKEIDLDLEIDQDDISTTYVNGVLDITVRKRKR